MAYKDENGKITIDDVAAGEDIRHGCIFDS